MFICKKLGFVTPLAFTLGLLCSTTTTGGQPANDVHEEQETERGLETSAQDLLALVQKGPGEDEKFPTVEKLDRVLESDPFKATDATVDGLTRRGTPPDSMNFLIRLPANRNRVTSPFLPTDTEPGSMQSLFAKETLKVPAPDVPAPESALSLKAPASLRNTATGAGNTHGIAKLLMSRNRHLRLHESKPVTVNNATFFVVAQTDWTPAKPHVSFPMVAPIEIQLHITNVSKHDAIFATCGTLGVKILDPNGKEVKSRRVSDGDILTRPILLTAGATYAICPRAEMRRDVKANAAELVYFEGNGGQHVIGPLGPGRYKRSRLFYAL